MPCPSYRLRGGRGDFLLDPPGQGQLGGGLTVRGGGGASCKQGRSPSQAAGQMVACVLQISAQWACSFASASKGMTLYDGRRQRITEHNIWGWVLRSAFSILMALWGHGPFGTSSSEAWGFWLPRSQASRCKQALDEPPQGCLDIHVLSGSQRTLVPSFHAAGRAGEWVMGQPSCLWR